MDNGFLRYQITLVKPDGSKKVLDHEATPHRCNIMSNRLEKLKKLGYTGELRFRVSKII